MTPPEPIVYLDYDGVLHPADVRVTEVEPAQPRVYNGGRPTSHPLFEHAGLLERLLQPFPVRIVLSTSWVRVLGFEYAVQQLPPGLRERVIGTIWQGDMLAYPPPSRHDAISTDAAERGVQRWLALDDDLGSWPAERLHLVVAPSNAWDGLAQAGKAEELTHALDLLCGGQALESRLPEQPHFPSTVDRLFGVS